VVTGRAAHRGSSRVGCYHDGRGPENGLRTRNRLSRCVGRREEARRQAKKSPAPDEPKTRRGPRPAGGGSYLDCQAPASASASYLELYGRFEVATKSLACKVTCGSCRKCGGGGGGAMRMTTISAHHPRARLPPVPVARGAWDHHDETDARAVPGVPRRGPRVGGRMR